MAREMSVPQYLAHANVQNPNEACPNFMYLLFKTSHVQASPETDILPPPPSLGVLWVKTIQAGSIIKQKITGGLKCTWATPQPDILDFFLYFGTSSL